MADAMISVLLDQLVSITREQVEEKMKLIMGVEAEVESLLKNLEAIRRVLRDAERRQLNDDAVRFWLDELKDVSYDMDTMVDEWNAGILKSEIEEGDSAITKRKVCFSLLFSCFNCSRGSHPSQVLYRLKIAKEIENLKGRIDDIIIRKDRFDFKISTSNDEPKLERPTTTSVLDVPVVYGQDKHKQDLLSQLLSGSSQEDGKGLQIISIVGMGGLGKTTLAKQVCNNDKVKAHFGKPVWVCVSDPFEIVSIAKQITEQLTGDQIPQMGLEILMQKFHESVKDRKFLLVLDDVWTNDYSKWAPLESALRSSAVGSRVLVTTRKDEVAQMIGSTHVIRMDKLSGEDCWTLLSEIAFFGKGGKDREDLAEVGRQIAQKCDGLPLAAKTLGGLLRIKTSKDEWLNVLKSDLWKLENVKANLFNPLLLSYYELPSEEKRCFSYCAIFPKDYEIGREALIQQWIAQGYFKLNNNEEAAEVTAQKCFDNLAMRSFFQDFEYDIWNGTVTTCKMHDIVHDFAQFLTLNEFSAISIIDAQESVESNVRHLNLMVSPTVNTPVSISNKKKLHSLMANGGVPDRLDLKRLRTLSLTGYSATLPTNIGELIHLRYLSVFDSVSLTSLPPAIGNLFNLQTLSLMGCRLEGLPEEVGKLINLRHLYAYYGDLSWPRGIGSLKHLQTLKRICISPNNENFQLQDLRNLNNIRDIYLDALGTDEKHVREAMEAQLCNKRDLINLILTFKGDNAYMEIQMNVLEALQPHENLKYLVVSHYMGRFISPSWMISLINLEKLVFTRCYNCEELPPFGKLPSLVSLSISRLNALKKLGPKFLGIENDNGAMMGDNKNGSVTLFPKLKKLIVERVESLSEWVGITGWKANGTLKIMPRLEDLVLSKCPSLEALPDFLEATPLKMLRIFSSPALERSCEMETGKDWPKIRHVPNIQIISEP